MLNKAQKEEDCEVCFKIKCRNCGWEPDEEEVQKILNKELAKCPKCGASPS